MTAEKAALAQASWFGEVAVAPGPGRWAQIEGADHVPADVMAARMHGRVGGAPIPAWVEGPGFRGDTLVCRVPEVHVLPRFGSVIDAAGQVYASTVGESLSWKPDLAALPYVRRSGRARLFRPPAYTPQLAAASVFMAKGGEFNYGHFLLDCLPALLALDQTGLARALPPIAPPLTPWQRDLIALAFPDLPMQEIKAPVVRLGEAAFATAMDHYLQHPHGLIPALRRRFLERSPRGGGAKRVYISRRAYPMRVMVDEPALEAALVRRGFVVAQTERLSAAEQIALVRDAEIVVGATGAGLANALFAPDGAKIVEIQPETFTNGWLRDLVHLCDGDWHGYFCPAPVAAREVDWRYRIRRGFRWGYRLGIDAFLPFLDERL